MKTNASIIIQQVSNGFIVKPPYYGDGMIREDIAVYNNIEDLMRDIPKFFGKEKQEIEPHHLC